MSEPVGAEQSVLADAESLTTGPPPKVPVNKTFRMYDQDQPMLLPPDLRDWLAVEHPARMVDDLVEHGLDLSAVYAGYTEVRGAPPYDPRLMLKILRLHPAQRRLRRHRRRSPRLRLRALPQRPQRLDLTPDELTGETTSRLQPSHC
jgi:hypothetical protein